MRNYNIYVEDSYKGKKYHRLASSVIVEDINDYMAEVYGAKLDSSKPCDFGFMNEIKDGTNGFCSAVYVDEAGNEYVVEDHYNMMD